MISGTCENIEEIIEVVRGEVERVQAKSRVRRVKSHHLADLREVLKRARHAAWWWKHGGLPHYTRWRGQTTYVCLLAIRRFRGQGWWIWSRAERLEPSRGIFCDFSQPCFDADALRAAFDAKLYLSRRIKGQIWFNILKQKSRPWHLDVRTAKYLFAFRTHDLVPKYVSDNSLLFRDITGGAWLVLERDENGRVQYHIDERLWRALSWMFRITLSGEEAKRINNLLERGQADAVRREIALLKLADAK